MKLDKLIRMLITPLVLQLEKFPKLKHFFWVYLSQKKEFRFHKKDNWRRTQDFLKQNDFLFKHWGFNEFDYENKVIIDIGAGSKLRSKYFRGSKIIAIEPLADKFVKKIDFCDLREAYKIYSLPAENMIEELKGIADLIICINVLDHVDNYQKVLNAAYFYLKNDGRFLLSVDLHETATIEHSVSLDEGKLESHFVKSNIRVLRKIKSLPNSAFYGQGETVTYILIWNE
ncbi:MAG: methyltransferase domain-containing protein [Melioribacteraceae bacterium]